MQTVVLVRRSRSRQRRHSAFFFYCFYLPLNFGLLYAAFLTSFPWSPAIKEAHRSAWLESYGPELWFSFHMILAILLVTITFWLCKYCYHPKRFFWLPLALGVLSLLLLQPDYLLSLIRYVP